MSSKQIENMLRRSQQLVACGGVPRNLMMMALALRFLNLRQIVIEQVQLELSSEMKMDKQSSHKSSWKIDLLSHQESVIRKSKISDKKNEVQF